MASNYENLSLWQAVRKWPRATMYILLCGLNVLLRGYDSAILSSVASLSAFQYDITVPLRDVDMAG